MKVASLSGASHSYIRRTITGGYDNSLIAFGHALHVQHEREVGLDAAVTFRYNLMYRSVANKKRIATQQRVLLLILGDFHSWHLNTKTTHNDMLRLQGCLPS